MPNRLAETLSPYLRSHADNPVEWFPWGEEAFAVARERDVPVLISIGYSTCHWCHVMARESFSDPATAALLNDGFVSIKVDREEHPDVDAAYLAAASAFTRDLGWPLTVFATPSGRAFHAGTYFPPEPRGGIPSFRQVLAAVREAWTERREQAIAQADDVARALAQVGLDSPSAVPNEEELRAAAEQIARREDPLYGGFGGAPKFPVATTLRFLQTVGVPEVASRALSAMASSELRDAVEGGFFRYATMRDWTVPHYERMLTDNAQLLDVARAAGDDDTAHGIARFLIEVLRRPGGGFGAAQDSESWIDGERSEGGYYRHSALERSELEPPAVDGKVITGWNGLAIAALARAGAALGEPSWIDAAAEAATFVLATNVRDGALVRSSLDGVPAGAVATAADLGLLADGLLALAAATGEVSWAVRGRDLVDAAAMVDPVLAARGIPAAADESDGDLPSGTASRASAAMNAWMLGAGGTYYELAESLVAGVADRARQHPFGYGAVLSVAARLARPPRQIVVIVDDDDASWELARAARRTDADLVAVVTPAQARAFADAGFSLFEGKDGVAGVAYDCRAFACRLPSADPGAL